ncbi:MAG: tRNA (adenosine(37)-N6)-threonylcarbamoyltransferase complex dimerization subunit type 1 TsaB [Bacteroidia bacterium]|nr:tRNA (adenosine(37)-N6)-threonylcarbamoyltransferase complex dimerization subunit type 1 TsaB [Bacteroidia bacterium]
MDTWGLVVETAGPSLQLGLIRGEAPVAGLKWDASNQHAERLIVLSQALLASHQLRWKDIQYAVYHQGPGSHTGLRIGLAAVKAWALSLGWIVYPVPLMHTLYRWARHRLELKGPIFTFWQSRPAEWYGQIWEEEPVSPPELLPQTEWERNAHSALWVGNHPSARFYVEEIRWQWVAYAARYVEPLRGGEAIAGLVPLYYRDFIPTARKP